MPALITRCPACATMFKVVPDQLRVSEGWVRCGHCGEVFDASAHLQPAPAVAPIGEPAANSAEPAQPAPVSDGQQAPGEQEMPPAQAAAPEGLELDADALADPARPASLPDPGPSSLPPDSMSSSPLTEIDEQLLQDEPDPLQLRSERESLQEDPLDRPFALHREDFGAPGEFGDSELRADPRPLEELGFVRRARREARWQQPAVRTLLLLALFVLLALLGLQVVLQERDRIAAMQPALRPWLARVCEPLGCRIASPRRIEAISIDGSAFSKLGADAYRLQVTVKNQAGIDVAMPAVELTLTDADDQPLVRRVLMPGELGASGLALRARAEWSAVVGLAVTDPSLASRVSGYRVLAFYP